jgi:serine palmitoyltransferase
MGARAIGYASHTPISLQLFHTPVNAVPPSFTKQRANVRDAPNAVVIEEALDDCKHVLVEGKQEPVLNCATSDFLSLASNRAVKAAAAATMEEYTFGSCGPRGFYGTTLKHLELEAAIADFMGTPESITYSDNTAAVASAIPAFAKRGDLLIVDAGVNHAVQTGCRLARSKVVTYKHNDMVDLAAVLQKVSDEDKKNPGRALQHRRFIIFEGVSAYWGDVAPVPDIVALAAHHKVRCIMDDCLGWGVLALARGGLPGAARGGRPGRGAAGVPGRPGGGRPGGWGSASA